MRCPFIDDEAVESEGSGGDDDDDDNDDNEIFQWFWPQPTCVSSTINQLSCPSYALNREKKQPTWSFQFFNSF